MPDEQAKPVHDRVNQLIAKLKKEATDHKAQMEKLRQRIALLEQVAANPEAHKDLLDILT